MANTVDKAFAEFQKDAVNLDPTKTTNAYKSRDWLYEQINALPGRYSNFPLLAPAYHLNYGSFARKTKIRPLNDIDMMVGLHGEGSTYMDYDGRIDITVNSNAQRLTDLCHDDTNLLNSKKVLNRFKAGLGEVPQYKSADIKYTQQAAVLNLSSYEWSFDIVPCFMTAEDNWGRTYYLIPDGNGYWMKTDPRIDKELTTSANQQHGGYVLNVLRLLKFWTKRPITTTIPSYLLETIVLKYYETKYTVTTSYPDVEIPALLDHIAYAIRWDVEDPKGIQGNINRLEQETRNRISAVATRYAKTAREARQHEDKGDQEASIGSWQEVFGSSFPSFD